MIRRILTYATLLTTFACTSAEESSSQTVHDTPPASFFRAIDVYPKRTGALYFMQVGNLDLDLDDLLNRSAKVIEEQLQISFSKMVILGEGEYPALKNTDILLYFIREQDAKAANLVPSFGSNVGACCVGSAAFTRDRRDNLFNEDNYESMKKLTNHPYDPLISATSLGFVIADHPSCFPEAINYIAIHEIGHFLGGAHIESFDTDEISQFPYLFYMIAGSDCSNLSYARAYPTFDPENVQKIHTFLAKTTNASREEIVERRRESLEQTVIVKKP